MWKILLWWLGVCIGPVMIVVGYILEARNIVALFDPVWWQLIGASIVLVSLAALLHQAGVWPGKERTTTISKTRLKGRKRVEVGDFLEKEWHGRKLRVELKGVADAQLRKYAIGTADSEGNYKEEITFHETIEIAQVSIEWGSAVIHKAERVSISEGHFLMPKATEGNEDYTSAFAFWNTDSAFWFLSVWVTHISKPQQFADIDFAIIVLDE